MLKTPKIPFSLKWVFKLTETFSLKKLKLVVNKKCGFLKQISMLRNMLIHNWTFSRMDRLRILEVHINVTRKKKDC